MPLSMPLTTTIEERLAMALPDLYRRQSAEGQACLLGFFHLLEGSSDVAVRLRVGGTGEMTLTLETAIDAPAGKQDNP